MKALHFTSMLCLLTSFKIHAMQLPPALKGAISIHCKAVQSDNKTVVLAARKCTAWSDIAIIRYNADGSLDQSFATRGCLTTSDGRSIILKPISLEIQDGKILTTSLADNNTRVQHCFLANGSIDSSFGEAGVLRAKP